MVSKITSTKRSRSRLAGLTIMEMLMAMGITGILMAALASMSMLSGRSFAAFANYVDLDDSNRIAMDTLTRDLRECSAVTACTGASISIQDSDGLAVVYAFDAGSGRLTRNKNNAGAKTLLKGCDALTFTIAQRNPIGGTYDVYPSATPATAKVVNVKWNCSRTIFGRKVNTENVQTARIVIRKQG